MMRPQCRGSSQLMTSIRVDTWVTSITFPATLLMCFNFQCHKYCSTLSWWNYKNILGTFRVLWDSQESNIQATERLDWVLVNFPWPQCCISFSYSGPWQYDRWYCLCSILLSHSDLFQTITSMHKQLRAVSWTKETPSCHLKCVLCKLYPPGKASLVLNQFGQCDQDSSDVWRPCDVQVLGATKDMRKQGSVVLKALLQSGTVHEKGFWFIKVWMSSFHCEKGSSSTADCVILPQSTSGGIDKNTDWCWTHDLLEPFLSERLLF